MSDTAGNVAKKIENVSLEGRMRESYLDYAMSVIVGRALPDVRDGLKPVHRRTLYAMREAGNYFNKPHKKSARIVGDVLGKFHPHSGEAVYDALVRLAQDFSMGLPLVDGQGNFGSIDGDNAAAMRYTEVRLDKISQYLLMDIEKETVDFVPNYDGAEMEPTCLPARFPNILVNGSTGIAVGMATNIPPHNLGETIDACLLLLNKPTADLDELMKCIPAPDFPTRGLISNINGIREAYQTGRGRVLMRSRTHFEPVGVRGAKPSPTPLVGVAKQAIVVDELPYQVNKASLIAHIAELARDKKIEGIADMRDESDRQGIRVVIELRRNENAEFVLNKLFKETALQENFSINMVCLDEGAPKILGLKSILTKFLSHRREVVVRRTTYELRKARERAHILEGLAVAVDNIDPIVELIKSSASPAAAEEELLGQAWKSATVTNMLKRLPSPADGRPEDVDPTKGLQKDGYHLSEAQAKAILDLRLAKLTGLEREKIVKDYSAVVDEILECLSILRSPEKIDQIIGEELTEVKTLFNSPRRSEITDIKVEAPSAGGASAPVANVKAEEVVVSVSHRGYIKRQPVAGYRAQNGGRTEDFINQIFVANTHDDVLLFTNQGRAYSLKVYELPDAPGTGRGQPAIQLLSLGAQEKIAAVLPVNAAARAAKDTGILFATAQGVIKRTELAAFANVRATGIVALDLKEKDRLVAVTLIAGENKLMLFTNSGKAASFASSTVRAMGRGAAGIRGIKLTSDSESVVALQALPTAEASVPLLIVADNGRGKLLDSANFTLKGRGSQGVIALLLKGRNEGAQVVGVRRADPKDKIVLVTNRAALHRMTLAEIAGRKSTSLGTELVPLKEGHRLRGVFRLAPPPRMEEK